MPLLGAFSFAAQKMPSRRKALRCGGEGKEQQQKHFGTPTKASTGECYRTGGRAAPWRATHAHENKSKTTYTIHDDTTGPERGDCMLVDGGSDEASSNGHRSPTPQLSQARPRSASTSLS